MENSVLLHEHWVGLCCVWSSFCSLYWPAFYFQSWTHHTLKLLLNVPGVRSKLHQLWLSSHIFEDVIFTCGSFTLCFKFQHHYGIVNTCLYMLHHTEKGVSMTENQQNQAFRFKFFTMCNGNVSVKQKHTNHTAWFIRLMAKG